VWAIHDKQKFDSLIQDLAFPVDNLEKVIERLGMPGPISGKVPGIESRSPSPPPRATIEPPRNLTVDGRSTSISSTPGLPGHLNIPAHGVPQMQLPRLESLEPLHLKELASSPGTTGHVAYVTQDVIGAGVGALGNIGCVGAAPRHILVATQTVRENALGAQGDVAADFALKLQAQQYQQQLALQELQYQRQLALQRASHALTGTQPGLPNRGISPVTLNGSPTDRRPK